MTNEPRYTIRLRGSQVNIALFGVIEFVRTRPVLRIILAALGIGIAAAGVATFFVSRGSSSSFPKTTGLFEFGGIAIAATSCLWAATVSGPRFKLVLSFEPEKAKEELREAEEEFEDSNEPEDALKVDLARLNEYYIMNQSQVRSSFRWAKFSMVVGFITIIAGIWLFYFRAVQPDKFMAGISTAAGCVVNLVSGLFFYLCFKMQERATSYYEQLSQLQKLYVAIRMVDSYEPSEQTRARDLVLQELLRSKVVGAAAKAKPKPKASSL